MHKMCENVSINILKFLYDITEYSLSARIHSHLIFTELHLKECQIAIRPCTFCHTSIHVSILLQYSVAFKIVDVPFCQMAQRNLPATRRKRNKGLSNENYCERGSRYSENLNF